MKNKEEEVKDNLQETVEETPEKEVTQEQETDSTADDSLAKLESELAEVKDKYLRLYSDFENFRKRNAKERLDLIKTASEDVLRDLIPVVDGDGIIHNDGG
nr:nucleotide exchange factor GrpE [Algoriphagus sp.]